MIQLVKTSFISFFLFFLFSCIGPVKEIKYQIEDSWEDTESFTDQPLPLNDLVNKFQIHQVWSGSLDGRANRNFSICKHDNLIYYSSSDGVISQINIIKKIQNWDYDYSENITSSIACSDNNAFFVDYDGFLISISSKGVLDWKSFVGEVFSLPLVNDGKIYVRTSDNELISLSIIDGSVIWKYKLPTSPLPIRSWGEMSIKNNIIYIGIASGKVSAVNALNGTLVWESTFSPPKGSSEMERSNDSTSKIIVDDFVIYAVSSQGNIASLSSENGQILWSRPLSSFNGMTHDKDNLYVTHNSGAIYAISKETSKVKWRNTTLLGRDVSRGFIFNNLMTVSDYQGYIHFIDLEDGNIIARTNISEDLILNPVPGFEDKSLIFISINGSFNEFSFNYSNSEIIKDKPSSSLEEININDSENTKNNKNIDNEDSIIEKLIFWD